MKTAPLSFATLALFLLTVAVNATEPEEQPLPLPGPPKGSESGSGPPAAPDKQDDPVPSNPTNVPHVGQVKPKTYRVLAQEYDERRARSGDEGIDAWIPLTRLFPYTSDSEVGALCLS